MTRAAKPKKSDAGRRCIYGDEAMKPRTIRMTDAQAEKLDRLGGAARVRKWIDAAKEQ